MLAEGFHGNRGLVPSSPSVRFFEFPRPPTTNTAVFVCEGREDDGSAYLATYAGTTPKRDKKHR